MKQAFAVVSCAFAIAVCSLTPRAALAENLVPNPGFDVNLGSWTASSGAAWSPEDAQAQEESGSALLLVAAPAPSGNFPSASIARCNVVDASNNYRFGGTVYRAGRATRSWAHIRISWFESATCGGLIASDGLPFSSTVWEPIEKIVKTPENAHSARIELEVGKFAGSSGVEIIGHFDDIVLEPVPKVPGTSTTTTTTLGTCNCGDPIDVGNITLIDAFYVLQAAVGQRQCDACDCDVDNDGGIDVIDALLTLRKAVGGGTTLHCPAD